MEKPHHQDQARTNKGRVVWDCGSSLYDSFELDSFKRQLDSAITTRTYSMPRLSVTRMDAVKAFPPAPQAQPTQSNSKKPSKKISKSLQKFIRSVFGQKSKSKSGMDQYGDELYGVYERYGSLTTIPEVPEYMGHSPELNSMVGRSVSERFRPSSIGISVV